MSTAEEGSSFVLTLLRYFLLSRHLFIRVFNYTVIRYRKFVRFKPGHCVKEN